MPNCPNCEKPVYFGNSIHIFNFMLIFSGASFFTRQGLAPALFEMFQQALRKDASLWKSLWGWICENEISQNYFQHEGKPYCNRCYGAIFGPKGYGHGGYFYLSKSFEPPLESCKNKIFSLK